MAVKRRKNPASVLEVHPLNLQSVVDVEIWHEPENGCYVTRIPVLFNISSFGDSEEEALDSTAEMLVGWIAAMEAEGKKIPLSKKALAELKQAVADWS
ncbi:MAG: hypothetical protein C0504_09360 [Candidatus Solibacter sp.]|nr:hypothetical protein [Candidatus Solibacter sp.]